MTVDVPSVLVLLLFASCSCVTGHQNVVSRVTGTSVNLNNTPILVTDEVVRDGSILLSSLKEEVSKVASEIEAVASTESEMRDTQFPDCSSLDPKLKLEVARYQDTVDRIIEFVTRGEHKGKTYDGLGHFVDTFGPRITGSVALEDSIDWLVHTAEQAGFDDVRTEDVVVPKWIRNSEFAEMVEPRVQKLNILGLGSSVGTSSEGLAAEIVVVTSFDELTAIADKVAGKIVVYNQPFLSYMQSVQYRAYGAERAARLGAVAVLVRSATDFSIASPHTGGQRYTDGTPKIPVASLAVEDARLLSRLFLSGESVKVNLTMGAVNAPAILSRNTIIDHRAREAGDPDDVVVISGHIDSWDVGTGTMDDAAGCFVSYHANLVLKQLGLRARRTVRTIWFTGEEQGLFGGKQYFEQHKNESEHYQVLLESDMGTFNPKGIGFSGSDTATCIMQEIVKLTASINTTELEISDDGPDIGMWKQIGVPIGSLRVDNSKYFWFHHSAGDTLDVEDTEELDRITALWASVAYVAADISVRLKDV